MSDRLTKFAFTEELTEAEREGLAEALEERRLSVGRPLFRAEDEAEELYLLVEGQLRLSIGNTDLAVLGVGSLIGGASLLAIGQRECTATAVTAGTVLVLTRAAYLRLRSDLPRVALALQESVIREIAGPLRASLGDLQG